MNKLLPFYQSLAEKSSNILLSRFSDSNETKDKSAGGLDIVTETDFELENELKKLILARFPNHGFWGEENGGKFKEYTWVVDPLDGTNNFGIGLAVAGTSITLLKNDHPIVGIITYPFSKTWFIGIEGEGVYKNHSQEKYSLPSNFIDKKRLATTIGNPIAGSKQNHATWLHKKMQLSNKFNRVLDMWCPVAGYYLLFSGSLSGFIAYQSEYYDLLAGYVIGKELGLNIVDFEGNPYTYKKADYISFVMTQYRDTQELGSLLKAIQ